MGTSPCKAADERVPQCVEVGVSSGRIDVGDARRLPHASNVPTALPSECVIMEPQSDITGRGMILLLLRGVPITIFIPNVGRVPQLLTKSIALYLNLANKINLIPGPKLYGCRPLS